MQSVRTTYVECRSEMSKQTSYVLYFCSTYTGWVKNLSKNVGYFSLKVADRNIYEKGRSVESNFEIDYLNLTRFPLQSLPRVF